MSNNRDNTVAAPRGSELGLQYIRYAPDTAEQVALGAGAAVVGGAAATAGIVAAPATGGGSAIAGGFAAANSFKWLSLAFGTREEDELRIYAPWRGEPIGMKGIYVSLGKQISFGQLNDVWRRVRPAT